jgi:hypothetical protein
MAAPARNPVQIIGMYGVGAMQRARFVVTAEPARSGDGAFHHR